MSKPKTTTIKVFNDVIANSHNFSSAKKELNKFFTEDSTNPYQSKELRLYPHSERQLNDSIEEEYLVYHEDDRDKKNLLYKVTFIYYL